MVASEAQASGALVIEAKRVSKSFGELAVVKDFSARVMRGDRVGIYFTESGASQRASVVIYDRAHSAVSEMAPDAVDWPRLFTGADWFHMTGITPALGPKARPAAKARLTLTAGVGRKRSKASYSASISVQSVASAPVARQCTAEIAAPVSW